MDKRKIIWSARAEKELLHILDFYIERNGNSKYSAKILDRVEKSINLLVTYTDLGHLTENKETRLFLFGMADKIQNIESISLDHNFTQTFFASVKNFIASQPPSLPTPLCFIPPKGVRKSRSNQQLIQMMPLLS